MPTFIPPSNNELLDQEAIEWAVAQGHIFWRQTSGVPAPPGDRIVWNADMVRTYVYGPDTTIPKTGGGVYASNECPTYADILAWGYNSAPPPPPDPVPTVSPIDLALTPSNGRIVTTTWQNVASYSVRLWYTVGDGYNGWSQLHTVPAGIEQHQTSFVHEVPLDTPIHVSVNYYNDSGSGPAVSTSTPTLFP